MTTRTPPHIRYATMEDYDSVCELLRGLDAFHVELLPKVFQSFPDPVRPPELIREKVSGDKKALFVAELGTKLVGLVDVQRASSSPFPMFKPREYALIDNLFVTKDFRGTGLARLLFERAKLWAKEQKLTNIQLTVYNTNRAAIRFYEKEGFVPLSTKYELDI